MTVGDVKVKYSYVMYRKGTVMLNVVKVQYGFVQSRKGKVGPTDVM